MKSRAFTLLATALLASGCVQQRRFRFVPAITACFPETANATPVAGPPDQKPSLDCGREQFKMAFIEFDENGRLFDPRQDEAARTLLEREKANAPAGTVITVVYIHGWKNNAAEAEPGNKPKDVEKFQGALLELGYRAAQARGEDAPKVPIVGIYMAWRGKTLMGPDWFTFASLWSRRNTANNIGDGPDLPRILNQIIEQTNAGNDTSRVLLVGHSFGARVLEHAIESGKVTLYDALPGDTFVRPRVDLVLYVNSANDSRLSMGRVQELRAAKLRVHHPNFDPKSCIGSPNPAGPPIDPDTQAAICRDYPLLVAITSRGDSATKFLLPAANTINGDDLVPSLADKLPPLPTTNAFADPAPSAGTVKKVAAGHFGFLQSHVVREITCPVLRSPAERERTKTTDEMIDEAVRRAVAEALGKTGDEAERRAREASEEERRRAEELARFERALRPVCAEGDLRCRFIFRTFGDKPACYQADQRQSVDERPPFNDTPFWIMSVEPTVIKDHGDIWNVSFLEMLGQLIAPRGFFEAASPRVQLRTATAPSK